MTIKTKLFGEIEKEHLTVLDFPQGLIGFPELKEFSLITDTDNNSKGLYWLVSLTDPSFALPVMDPLTVKPGYTPAVIGSSVESVVGKLTEDNLFILVTVTIPHEVKNISVNLAAPIIINVDELKGIQPIIENDEYEVKYMIFDIIK